MMHLALRVGQHACDLRGVRLRYQDDPAKFGLSLIGLGGQNVAHLRLTALELARGGLLEALCSARVGFQLWHGVPC